MKDLNKILSGDIITKVGEHILITHQPSARQRYLADFFADQAYEDAFEQGVFIQEETEKIVIDNGWWTQEKEEEMSRIPKEIEQMKLDYYNNFVKDQVKSLIKKAIRKKEERYEELIEDKYMLFGYSCESIRSKAYEISIIRQCTKYLDGRIVNFDRMNIDGIYSNYKREILTDKEIRQLSKSSDWRLIWSSSKDGRKIFSVSTCDLSDMQKSIVSWSRMYDNIYESMDVPSDEVIQDDIAIDGWFVAQSRKREDEQKKSQADSMPESAEVFVPVGSQKEARKVHEMNTEEGKKEIGSRMKDLKERGSLDEGKFSHVKQDMQMKSNQAVFNHYK